MTFNSDLTSNFFSLILNYKEENFPAHFYEKLLNNLID